MEKPTEEDLLIAPMDTSNVSSNVPADGIEDETKDTDSESAAPAGSGRFWCHVCRCVQGFGNEELCAVRACNEGPGRHEALQ